MPDVEGELRVLQEQAQKAPGINDVLRVYGGLQEAVERAEFYLSLTKPSPPSSVSNSTS